MPSLFVKVPKPTGTSIAPWCARCHGPIPCGHCGSNFARYWTRSGRSRGRCQCFAPENFGHYPGCPRLTDCQDEQR